MSNIATVTQSAIDALLVGKEIYAYVVGLMDSYQEKRSTGAEKKAIVLTLARDLILDLGKDWEKWERYISDFIDTAKALFNAVRKII